MTRILPNPGCCAFGAVPLRERIIQLAEEIGGVRRAEDTGAVHRMRGASLRDHRIVWGTEG